MAETENLSLAEIEDLAFRALSAAGTTPKNARPLAVATAATEADGVASHGLACPSPDVIPHTPLDEIRGAFARADTPDAEALVHVGTGLPVLHQVGELERTHGKPVVACNAALYWQALRETGIPDPIQGFGRLLAEH